MWDGKSISLIFPAYNEEKGIGDAVSQFKSLKGEGGEELFSEIVVVDNNSTDRTAQIAAEKGARVVTETLQGYGNALQRGLKEAQSELLVLCEPDGTFVAKDIYKLLVYSSEFEMVCGTRTTKECIWAEANMKFFLRKGNWVVAKMMQFLYNCPSLSDCGCTFRLIRRGAYQRLVRDLYVGDAHFLPNMVIAAKKNNVNFLEIPLNYRGRVGESKITGTSLGTWKTGLNMIALILGSWPSYFWKGARTQLPADR